MKRLFEYLESLLGLISVAVLFGILAGITIKTAQWVIK